MKSPVLIALVKPNSPKELGSSRRRGADCLYPGNILSCVVTAAGEWSPEADSRRRLEFSRVWNQRESNWGDARRGSEKKGRKEGRNIGSWKFAPRFLYRADLAKRERFREARMKTVEGCQDEDGNVSLGKQWASPDIYPGTCAHMLRYEATYSRVRSRKTRTRRHKCFAD